MSRTRFPYQYVVLRCVPRPDREEFVNVGVLVFCEARDFLQVACRVDEQRLLALDPRIDPAQVRAGLDFVAAVCAGDARAGWAAEESLNQRFGFLKAPRSTVIQPGPVHGGLTDDPARQLEHLLERLAG